MYKIISVLFLFVATQNSCAQKNLVNLKDSIALLNFKELHKKSKLYLYKDSIKSKIVHQVIQKKIAEDNNESKDKLIAFSDLFYWKYTSGDFNVALKYSDSVRKTAKSIKNQYFYCLSFITTGLTYYEMGEYDLAIQYNFKALDIASTNNLTELKFAAEANIGKFKLACADYQGSITILENCFQNLKDDNIEKVNFYFPEVYSDLTIANLKDGNIEKAIYYNNVGKKYSNQFNYYQIVQAINEAKIEIEKQNYNRALDILNPLKNFKKKNHDVFNIKADFHLTKGKSYFFKKEYDNALKEFLKLEQLENKKRIHHLNFQEGYSYIAKTYVALGKNNHALTYYNKALKTFSESEKEKIKLIAEIENKSANNTFESNLKKQNLSNSVFLRDKYTALQKDVEKLNIERKQKNTLIYLSAILILIFIVIGIAFVLKSKNKNKLKFEALLEKNNQLERNYKTTQSQRRQEVNHNIDAKEVDRILKKITQLENNEFFLKTNCTLVALAKEIKTNTTYVSKIINAHYRKNFTSYINDLRINYVLKRLQEDNMFRKYSIQAIANEVGFKSKESFNSVFKKQTGILPSYFINELEKTNSTI